MTGKLLNDKAFVLKRNEQMGQRQIRILETSHLRANDFLSLVYGQVAAIWLRNALDQNLCHWLTGNFRRLTAPERADGVSTNYIGANMYLKTPEEYYNEHLRSIPLRKKLVERLRDPHPLLEAQMRRFLLAEFGIRLRPANYEGLEAPSWRASSFHDVGEYALKPHDDLAQTKSPLTEGWEIEEVIQPIAVNSYFEVPKNQGALRIFGAQGTPELWQQFGIEGVGYPHPQEFVGTLPYLDVPVRTGDIVLLDGRYIHAVLECPDFRLLTNGFVGIRAQGDALLYT